MRYVLFFLCLSSIVSIEAQQQQIASAKITFEFPAKEVKGSVEGFTSSSILDWDNPENSKIQGTVRAETLDTNNGLRNWSLRSSRYFGVKEYPQMSFKSTSVREKAELWIVTGDLTIKGITKEFQIVFKRTGTILKGTGELYSSDFDIKIKKRREDNLVKVNFVFTLVP